MAPLTIVPKQQTLELAKGEAFDLFDTSGSWPVPDTRDYQKWKSRFSLAEIDKPLTITPPRGLKRLYLCRWVI
jgi:hypothetical protein